MRYAQFGAMRFGNFRFGCHSPKAFVNVGGEQRAFGKSVDTYKIENIRIAESDNATPNKASFEAQGWVPVAGMEVIITLGSINKIRRLFAGTVVDIDESNAGEIRTFQVECLDWNWLLNAEPVYGYYTGSPSDIARQLMLDYAPAGFTVRQVEDDLPTLPGGITFTGVKLSAALDRLAKRAGARQFIDYQKDLYFRVTPSAVYTNPTDIVASLNTLKQFRVRRGLGQIANRVPFEGGGSSALTEVSVGETILPLEDAPDWWYGDVGGVVLSGPQKITYTARVEGGGGSLVGAGAQPSSAPTLSLAAGAGVTSGLHDVTVGFKTALGRSLPSSVVSINVGTVPAPSSAVTAGTPTAGGSMNAGTHRYYPVFRSAAGSTTGGPVSNSVTVDIEVGTPTNTLTLSGLVRSGSGLDLGALYGYTCTFWDGGSRETMAPGGHLVDLTASQNAGRILISSIPTPPPGYQVRFYRTKGGEGLYYLLPSGQAYGQFADSVGGYYIDTKADTTLGVQEPQANTTLKGTCQVTSVPVSLEPLVTHVDMYREFNSAGAATAKLAFSVANGVISASDTVANASLGALVPSSNTAVANQVTVSAPIGGSGTTDREFWMSPAGGGARKLALTIPNNTATTGTITISDATLAGEIAEPVVDTSGLAQPSGQVNPGSTSLLVAGTAPFLAAGGWAFSGTQVVRYASFSGSSLAGIPPSGPGSIQQVIPFNSVIAAARCLIGIPSSGAGSILYTIPKGEAVNLYVVVEDTDAQAYLASVLDDGSDGVRECPPLQDRRVNRSEALSRAQAFLSLRAMPSVSVGPYRSKDMNNRVPAEVNISIVAPASVNDTFKIQSVTIDNFTPNIAPDYTVLASDELFSIDDLLSREP